MGTFFMEEGTPAFEAVVSSRKNLKLAYQVLLDIKRELEENPEVIQVGKNPDEVDSHCIVMEDTVVYLTGDQGEVPFRAEIGKLKEIEDSEEVEEEIFFYSVLLEPEDEGKFMVAGLEIYNLIKSFENKVTSPESGKTYK